MLSVPRTGTHVGCMNHCSVVDVRHIGYTSKFIISCLWKCSWKRQVIGKIIFLKMPGEIKIKLSEVDKEFSKYHIPEDLNE